MMSARKFTFLKREWEKWREIVCSFIFFLLDGKETIFHYLGSRVFLYTTNNERLTFFFLHDRRDIYDLEINEWLIRKAKDR